MFNKQNTVQHPDQDNKLYIRIMYRTFFIGPFDNIKAVGEAMKGFDVIDSYWDYDCSCVIYGKSDLPSDYVNGFDFITEEEMGYLDAIREASLN